METSVKIIFSSLDKLVFEKYEEVGLQYLDQIKINDKKITSIYHQIIDKKMPLHNFNNIEFIHDIVFISKDIKYFTCLLFLLKPYINIPTKENNTYFQNPFDTRYLTFASVVHQNVYNFWDRIGDLLYFFFDTGLDQKRVYFSTVINNFPAKYRNSKNYIELKNLYEQKLKSTLDQRSEIVHSKQLETKHYLGTFQNYEDMAKRKELEDEKITYAEYFQDQLKYTNEGFIFTLNLIDELSNK